MSIGAKGSNSGVGALGEELSEVLGGSKLGVCGLEELGEVLGEVLGITDGDGRRRLKSMPSKKSTFEFEAGSFM